MTERHSNYPLNLEEVFVNISGALRIFCGFQVHQINKIEPKISHSKT